MSAALKQVNWLDIVLLILFFRICFMAARNGLPAEIFKFLGTISSIYLAYHYYVVLADLLEQNIPVKLASLAFLDFFSFVLLAFIGYWVFIFLRRIFSLLVKLETAAKVTEWFGLILGIIRGLLFCSLLVSILLLSGAGYLEESVRYSLLGKPVAKIAPFAYRSIWEGLVSKFMIHEKLNSNLPKIEEEVKVK